MSREGRLYRAISDPTRRLLLDTLMTGDKTAGELAEGCPGSRPSISKHLRLLKEACLVSERREGRHRIYTLDPQPMAEIDSWIQKYRVFWSARLARIKDYVESESVSESESGSESESDTDPKEES